MRVSLLLSMTVLMSVHCILIPIDPSQNPCMSAFTDYEPLKLQVTFPTIPHKVEGEKFLIQIKSTEDLDDVVRHYREQGDTFKSILNLTENVLYEICFEIVTKRSEIAGSEGMFISYHVTDDLENLIGTIQVPKDLAKQKKLADLYTYASEIKKINSKISQSQDKERKLQDQIAQLHIQKNFRIISLTLIECAVIILSGIYQVFALRRFLIDKNLY